MTTVGWSVFGAAAAGVLGLALYARKRAGLPVSSGDDRAGKTGIVPGDPVELARAAGVPVDVYSLARCMETEEGGKAGRIAVGWATRNAAERQRTTITKLVTRAQYKDKQGKLIIDKAAAGKYSSQDHHKWCGTKDAPTAATLELAKQIAATPPKIPDPTGGATQWDAPELQAKLHAKNPKKWKSPAEVAAKRQAAGKRMVMVPGVPKTRFWA